MLKSIPFYSLVESYLASREVFNKEQSVRNARLNLRALVAHFGARDLRSLTQQDFESFVQAHRTGRSPNSVNATLRYLKAYLRWCVEERHLDAMPFRVRMLRAPKRRVVTVLGPEQVEALLARAADEATYGIMLIAAYTGFRLSEIVHLTWTDWQGRRLTITPKRGWTSKSHQHRSAYIPERVEIFLKDWKPKQILARDTDFIFSTRNHTALSESAVGKKVRATFKAAGLYIPGQPCLHRIRYSVGTHLLRSGMNLRDIQALLGHADLQTTAGYLMADQQALEAAPSRLPW